MFSHPHLWHNRYFYAKPDDLKLQYLQFSNHYKSRFSRINRSSFIQQVKRGLRAVDEQYISSEDIEMAYIPYTTIMLVNIVNEGESIF